jgi:hypothetical protein
MRNGGVVRCLERSQDLESGGDDVYDAIGRCDEEIRGAGAERREIGLSKIGYC